MEDSIEELEARLYAQIHHENHENIVEQTTETADYLPPNLNKQSKRYWQKSKNLSTQKDFQPFHNSYNNSPQLNQQTQPKTPLKLPKEQPQELSEPIAPSAIKSYVPYSSVLSFMGSPSELSKEADELKSNNYEKKKSKATKFPKNGRMLNPLNSQGVTKGKSAMKLQIQAKKQKALIARKKAQNRVFPTIELEDSDESDCVPVELPSPPLITLDDSSDEETIKKKRALSPSISSIMSDDFIVAGDKRRIANPFRQEEAHLNKLKDIVQQKESLEKVKALTKVASSTSSSDSARSSCERNVNKAAKSLAVPEQKKSTGGVETRSKRKSTKRSSLDNEDSIYGAKGKIVQQPKAVSSDSSEEETPCVNARPKPTGSRKKSECDDDPIPGPIAQRNKRSRFITPSYNDTEFATMISSIVRSNDVMQDEPEEEGDNEKTETTAVKSPEPGPSNSVPLTETTADVVTIVDDTNTGDCELIETPLIVYEIPDEDDKVVSDSDDSMRGFKLPINCDLSLNVTQVPYDPHEYIRDYGESSKEVAVTTIDALVNPEIGWNDEMKFFYDGSWGDENFCISTILNEMPRDQKFWRVINADRNRMPDAGKRIRCLKCNEVGHFSSKCNRPKKRVVCFMCGEEGHRETRCPNSICLKCGKPNKIFATTCSSCHKLSKKYCPLCNYQGHDIEHCPDKWRRYHSTTTDSETLNSEYKINERVYCSICARRGHFAENCNRFLKAISGLITSSVVRITSHKASYPRIYLNSFDPIKGVEKDQQQLLALFTYFPNYRFNFQFSRCVRMYPKFMEQFRLHKMRKETQIQPAIEASTKEKKMKKKRKRDRESVEKLEESSGTLQISVASNGDRTITSTDTSTTEVHDHDSNSNYSFSEFYAAQQQQQQSAKEKDNEVFKSPNNVAESSFDKAIKAVKENHQESEINVQQEEEIKFVPNPFAVNALQLADYIPLGNNENAPRTIQIEREPEVPCEARMMLTKEHFLMLTNEKGQNFLYDLQNRLNVVAEFKWDNTGNSLLITGIPSDQSTFHLEVREYLYQLELMRHERIMEVSSQLPKNKVSIVSFLKINLQSINKLKFFSAKRTLDTMMYAEKQLDHKKTLKCRKTLNIAFVGAGELCDGGQHIGALRRILFILEKEIAQGKFDVNQQLREEITFHMKPIFSTMNHGDYRNLFSQYSKVMKQRQKKNLLYNPILN